jgi:hypothetical protein
MSDETRGRPAFRGASIGLHDPPLGRWLGMLTANRRHSTPRGDGQIRTGQISPGPGRSSWPGKKCQQGQFTDARS